MSLDAQITTLAQAMGADVGKIMRQINGKAADLSGLTTSVKTSLLAALNEVHALVLQLQQQPGGVTINDAATASGSTWSSQRINEAVTNAVAGLVNSAPAALDTLQELAAALGNNPNYATTVNTALGNRVRFDASQTLSAAQQKQASQNIGVGDPETDFTAAYTAARTTA